MTDQITKIITSYSGTDDELYNLILNHITEVLPLIPSAIRFIPLSDFTTIGKFYGIKDITDEQWSDFLNKYLSNLEETFPTINIEINYKEHQSSYPILDNSIRLGFWIENGDLPPHSNEYLNWIIGSKNIGVNLITPTTQADGLLEILRILLYHYLNETQPISECTGLNEELYNELQNYIQTMISSSLRDELIDRIEIIEHEAVSNNIEITITADESGIYFADPLTACCSLYKAVSELTQDYEDFMQNEPYILE